MNVLSRCIMFVLMFVLPFVMTVRHVTAQSPFDAAAPTYPNKIIRIIVASPAGGPTDVLARVIGQRMNEDWGQPVVIENHSGANGEIGARLAAKASPDGYTLFAALDTAMVMNPIMMTNLAYDPFKDFAPITMLAKNTLLLVVRAADGPKTVQELIAKAKANPGKLNYGAGVITTRLAAYQFCRTAGIDAVFVQYKGSADVAQGLLTGGIDFTIDGIAPYLALIQSGMLRAMAKADSRPLPALPELEPLAIAADLPGMGEISTWIGLVAPAGTPPAIIDKINRTVVKMYADPEIVNRLQKAGINATSSSPAEFNAFFRAEADRWSQFVKETGIKFD
jgi:tripartite-type tricarboxylate transporter receptor subunit TctC